ncbi:hypothetical protein PENTCL1PPCAC_73, partial [Pristionchus entomophagus]
TRLMVSPMRTQSPTGSAPPAVGDAAAAAGAGLRPASSSSSELSLPYRTFLCGFCDWLGAGMAPRFSMSECTRQSLISVRKLLPYALY